MHSYVCREMSHLALRSSPSMEVFYLYIKQLQTVPMALHACVCVRACVCACMHVQLHTQLYIHLSVHACERKNASVAHVCSYVCVRMCKYCIAGNFDGEKF